MNHKEELISIMLQYKEALTKLKLNPERLDAWMLEVEAGKLVTPEFRKWIDSLANWYGEKDREFAAYLVNLLK